MTLILINASNFQARYKVNPVDNLEIHYAADKSTITLKSKISFYRTVANLVTELNAGIQQILVSFNAKIIFNSY